MTRCSYFQSLGNICSAGEPLLTRISVWKWKSAFILVALLALPPPSSSLLSDRPQKPHLPLAPPPTSILSNVLSRNILNWRRLSGLSGPLGVLWLTSKCIFRFVLTLWNKKKSFKLRVNQMSYNGESKFRPREQLFIFLRMSPNVFFFFDFLFCFANFKLNVKFILVGWTWYMAMHTFILQQLRANFHFAISPWAMSPPSAHNITWLITYRKDLDAHLASLAWISHC